MKKAKGKLNPAEDKRFGETVRKFAVKRRPRDTQPDEIGDLPGDEHYASLEPDRALFGPKMRRRPDDEDLNDEFWVLDHTRSGPGLAVPIPQEPMREALAAWFRYGKGITSASDLVSQWADQSGNARDLKQATDTNKPALQADGSILFDGVDNFMACDAFTLNQPATVYVLLKQVTWTIDDRIFDGNTLNSIGLRQDSTTPQIGMIAGATGPSNTALAVGSYGVVASVFNGAASVLQVNNTTSEAANAGANNAGGFVIGARGAGAGASASNIQVKEVLIYAAAHNAAERKRVIDYLAYVGGLSI